MLESAQYALHTFGGFSLERDLQPCLLAYEKGRALLAYLAAQTGTPHARDRLAAMLWPDLDREAALTNLRQVLRNLRLALADAVDGHSPLIVDRNCVRLDASEALAIDAAPFPGPLPACPPVPSAAACAECLGRMEKVAASYRGEFMAGFSLPDCPDFEEWLNIQREAFHSRALLLLARLSDCHERAGRHLSALPFARRFLSLEPWNEEAVRRVMRLLGLGGQRAAALAVYESCRSRLKENLGIAPSEETAALAEDIWKGRVSAAAESADDVLAIDAAAARPAELRQVTALYCELALAEANDDLDKALALLGMPRAHCQEILTSNGGYLVTIHGGGLLAYFGYPRASENAARQAVRAALSTVRTRFPGIVIRIGIHTGMVVSGGDPQLPDAVGTTSAKALSVRQLAGGGEVVVSEATRALIAGHFETTALGSVLLADGRQLPAFRIDRQCPADDRLEATTALSRLIGRDKELAALRGLWSKARRGTKSAVLLLGDAGIGKSRLTLAIKESARAAGATVLELRCHPEHGKSPFFPLRTFFADIVDASPDDSPEQLFDKLAKHVEANYAQIDGETVPLLAKLLGLPAPSPYGEPLGAPLQQRAKTLAILHHRLYALAERSPVLIVMEDLHWADPSTLEFVNAFVDVPRQAPILGILTARAEFVPRWREGLVRAINLGALAAAETATLVATLAPKAPPSTIARIVDRSDGIPLYAEELARDMRDDTESQIPSTLRDLLAMRLDGMGAAKFLAQAAATVGREFSVDLLRKISDHDDDMVAQLLLQLKASGVLDDSGDGLMQFRHVLIRDAAYQSQTRPEREATHRRIVASLKTAEAPVRPELLAQHCAAGGDIRAAISHWIEAGSLAAQDAANHEAVMHFRSGLALIGRIPAGQERLRLELELHIGLGNAACAAEGYASPEGLDAYRRAIALCARHEGGPSMFRAIWGLWAGAGSHAGYRGAQELTDQLLRIASQSGNEIHLQQAHFAAGNAFFWRGEFTAARQHLEAAAGACTSAHHKTHIVEFGEDCGVAAGAYASWTLWMLGLPDLARRRSAETVALARRLDHRFSLGYALTFAAILHCRLRQPEAAIELASEDLALANAHGFPLWQIGAKIALAWAQTMQGNARGIDTLIECVAATRTTMGGVTLAALEPLLNAHVEFNQADDALRVADEALRAGWAIGDSHAEAEIHRLQGEALLRLQQPSEKKAQTSFELALTVSRRQHARSIELRAATSLARLWQTQGRTDEARRLIEGACAGFTERFDTPDLRDARRLLESLTG
jgi:DNA-binding SARP family transcriptional activator/predicted ATPase